MDETTEHPLANFCMANNIRQVVITPGEKELQGLVERSHRQDDQELYSRIEPVIFKDMNDSLWENWKAPDEWLKEYYLKKIVQIFKGIHPFSSEFSFASAA
jgi:hypothetical protein